MGAEAAKAIDAGGAQGRHARRVLEQTGQIVRAQIGQQLACIALPGCCSQRTRWHKGVAARGQLNKRLVQMPAAGHDAGKRRTTHKGGVIAGAPQRLPHRASKKHHVVGSGQRVADIEHGLELTGPDLDFQGAQGQIERLCAPPNDGQHRITLVQAGF